MMEESLDESDFGDGMGCSGTPSISSSASSDSKVAIIFFGIFFLKKLVVMTVAEKDIFL